MSYGDEGKILANDGIYVKLKDFIDPFKRNGTLANKPKMCFFQACRGNQEMPTLEQERDSSYSYNHVSDAKVPIGADFL